MPLCFAYGSNMDRTAMAVRCPLSQCLGAGRLPAHRFLLMREGYASVARDPTRCVHGLLWDLALRDVAALDRYEAVATGLYAKSLRSIITPRGTRRALVYVGRNTDPGRPPRGYMEAVLLAAEAAGLPAGYVDELRTHLGEPATSRQRSSVRPRV